MTSLPILLPPGYSPVVKKGDKVAAGQLLAKSTADHQALSEDQQAGSEVVIDLTIALGSNASSVRKFLKKAPGDSVGKGEIIAEKSASMGLKKQVVLSEIAGTLIRFERDSGKLYIRTEDASHAVPTIHEKSEILSPLAGVISLCNNDQIVIETESKAIVGTVGSGGTATGEIIVLSPEGDKVIISSSQITKDLIDKIVLLPDIAIEALVKADAIGVAGILGTEVSDKLIEYINSHKVGLPVIVIDATIGKKLLKIKNPVTLHGEEKSILLQE